MTVYVDEFQHWAPTKLRCFQKGSCHMLADTELELHAMARKLGLRRSWFQFVSVSVPHYDLTEGKRTKALKLGAVFKPAKEQARERMQKRREGAK